MDLIEDGIRHPIKHWYYQHKYWFIERTFTSDSHFEKKLIDVGAGSALFSKELLRKSLVNSVIAVDTGYPEDYTDLNSGIHFRKVSNFGGFSHYLLTDVLEHIKDDNSFLTNIVKAATPKSKFIITVPALMSLWSNHDVYLKHFRRYSKKELKRLVHSSNLEILECRYTYSTVFPIAYLQRKFLAHGDTGSHLRENNAFISFLLRCLLFPDKKLSFMPFGVSLFVVAIKR
jgi:hypothetical protein